MEERDIHAGVHAGIEEALVSSWIDTDNIVINECEMNARDDKLDGWNKTRNTLGVRLGLRSAIFRKMMRRVSSEETLIWNFPCSLGYATDGKGYAYLSQSYFCFYAIKLGWEKKLMLRWLDITEIAKLPPNANQPGGYENIHVCEKNNRYLFSSKQKFSHIIINHLWQNALLGKPLQPPELRDFLHQVTIKNLNLAPYSLSPSVLYRYEKYEPAYTRLRNNPMSSSPLRKSPSKTSQTQLFSSHDRRTSNFMKLINDKGNGIEDFAGEMIELKDFKKSSSDSIINYTNSASVQQPSGSEEGKGVKEDRIIKPCPELPPSTNSSVPNETMVPKPEPTNKSPCKYAVPETKSSGYASSGVSSSGVPSGASFVGMIEGEKTFIVNQVFNFNVNDLYDQIFDPESETMNNLFRELKFEEVFHFPCIKESEQTFSRTLCYKMPLGLKLFGCSKHINVTETQQTEKRHKTFYVVKVSTQLTGIPYSDSFHTETKYYFTYAGEGRTRLRITMETKFTVYLPGYLKGMINSRMQDGVKDGMEKLVKILRTKSDTVFCNRSVLKAKADLEAQMHTRPNTVSNVEIVKSTWTRPSEELFSTPDIECSSMERNSEHAVASQSNGQTQDQDDGSHPPPSDPSPEDVFNSWNFERSSSDNPLFRQRVIQKVSSSDSSNESVRENRAPLPPAGPENDDYLKLLLILWLLVGFWIVFQYCFCTA